MNVPALCERREDIPQLAERLNLRFAEEEGREPQRMTDAFTAQLAQYAWPGNLSELRSIIERATLLAGEGSIEGGLQLAERLRDAVPDLKVQSNLGGGSFKAQFKRADRSGAPLALVLGEGELANEVATVKHLREQKPQQQIPFDQLANWLTSWSTKH